MCPILLLDVVFPSWVHVKLPKSVKAKNLVIDRDEMLSFVCWIELKTIGVSGGSERLPFQLCIHAIVLICFDELEHWKQVQRYLIFSRLILECWRLL